MDNKISLFDFFEHLSSITGRNEGQKLREQIDIILNKYNNVIIDFENIDLVTQSFADEVFGIIIRTKGSDFFKEKIKIKNINDFNKNIIKWVFSYCSDFNQTHHLSQNHNHSSKRKFA